ncbi:MULTISPECIES: threonine/serine exporter family protein [unclassified Granulicatella]|uniref:threonine/serine exporter family protein n=1 Tax=unclassified Granulicatella TaxID=2630493 RepID=UPI0010739CDE|nr:MULTISPECIES: threonine/serine exporter family protein [unclassified Granulicatella]MBF0780269.1 threonine/serine exporter family protein [Granulicatella sp. 19428wC4_WM01]TFU95605.1 threonine/serine exporter [Granulicatella sp. WM01]
MMPFIIAVLSSFIAVYAGSITLNSPRKALIPAGLGGVVCWIAYILITPHTTSILANFYASLAVATYSQIMARVYKMPVTLFFIPGFLPIVPGVTIFRSVYYYISGNNDKFYTYLSETIQIATLIALGIVLTDALFKAWKRMHTLLKHHAKKE